MLSSFLFVGGMHHSRSQLKHVREAAQRANSTASSTQRELAYMEDRLDRLTLICTAMWELLSERAGASEEDLLEKVREIDLRDGVEDGKIGQAVAKCPACGRTMHPRHQRCLYCGEEKLQDSAFDGLGG